MRHEIDGFLVLPGDVRNIRFPVGQVYCDQASVPMNVHGHVPEGVVCSRDCNQIQAKIC